MGTSLSGQPSSRAHNRKPTDDKEKGEGEAARTAQGAEAVASLASRISTLQASSLAQDESVKRVDVGCLDNRGSVKAFAEKFNSGDLGKGSVSPDAEPNDKVAEKTSAQSKSPATSTGSLASQRHPGKFPKVPGRRRGTRGETR